MTVDRLTEQRDVHHRLVTVLACDGRDDAARYAEETLRNADPVLTGLLFADLVVWLCCEFGVLIGAAAPDVWRQAMLGFARWERGR